MRTLHLLLVLICFWQIACTPPDPDKDKPKPGKVNLDLNSKLVQRIYDLQDQHRTDSVLQYFTHKDPTMRYLAALAFASTLDTLASQPTRPILRGVRNDVTGSQGTRQRTIY